ncbi:hypothetical protein [Plantactinospora sonchi]|uniref:Cell wall anchor protein n=1 Tax=Plantactinospora sonchi TaxID=1544735 RepID=A0ABU7RXJ4_9ACTN
MTTVRAGLLRAGGAALLAVGAVAMAGAPSYAAGAGTDLELSVAGTRLAANAPDKEGWVKVTNNGTDTPESLTIFVDTSKVDYDKAVVIPVVEDCGATGPRPELWDCEVPKAEIPGPGQTAEFPLVLFRRMPDVGAYSAPVTFTIESPGDSSGDDNSRTVDVTFTEEGGVDLGVLVPDVKDRQATPAAAAGTPLRAGDTTSLLGYVTNWGDAVAVGVKMTVRLPERVTFAEVEPDCDYSADNRVATCEYPEVVLDANPELGHDLAARFWWPVTVDADVTGPVTLPDGSWTVQALRQEPVGSPAARRAAPELPENVTMVNVGEAGVTEVDASDNSDGFAVVVSDGAGDGGGGGAGEGDGGGLPVTGVQAGLTGGVGLAVVAAGVLMFVASRRRRVVLVTPGDEKSDA